MAGSATPRERIGRRIKDNEDVSNTLHGLIRRLNSPTSISTSSFSGGSPGSSQGTESNYLKTSGGTMLGAIAWRNAANTADLQLSANFVDQFVFTNNLAGTSAVVTITAPHATYPRTFNMTIVPGASGYTILDADSYMRFFAGGVEVLNMTDLALLLGTSIDMNANSIIKTGSIRSNSVDTATDGFVRTHNNTIGVAWRNAANTSNLELKAGNFDNFQFTNSLAGSTITLELYAQHATAPHTFSIIQVPGASGYTILDSTAYMRFFAGGVEVLNMTDLALLLGTSIDMNANSIIKTGSIRSNSVDTATAGFVRTHNNTIGVAWRNAANTSNLELKANTVDQFEFTNSLAGAQVDLKVWAQHATAPQTFSIVQVSGASGYTILDSTAYMRFFAEGSEVLNLTSTTATVSNGVKWTFNPDGTYAGINFGSQAGAPSTLTNGDVWYDSTATKFKARENGVTVDLISGGTGDMVLADAQTVTGIKTFNDDILKIRNPANTYSYIISSSAITADRTLTIPLITGTDTLAVLGLSQTFTGGTIAFAGASSFSVTSPNIFLGDSTTDTIAITAHINDHLIPDATGTYNLGSSSLRWANTYSSVFLYDSNHAITMSASQIVVNIVGAGDSFAINDGTGDRITYDYDTDDFSPIDNIASLGKSGRRWEAVWAVNGTVQTSFSKYKQNIKKLDCSNCLDTIQAMDPISFEWADASFDGMKPDKKLKSIGKKHMGFNADPLVTMCPEACAGEDGIYQGSVIGLLIGAVKELSTQVKLLKIK